MIINTINTSGCQPQTIVIGRRGTYDTMQIAFNLSYLVESYGNGVAVLAVKRSQDSSAYPAVTTQEDDLLLWTVSETDTYYVGAGECQLMWYVDGGLAKTIIYPMVVMRDILATAEEAPGAYQTWVDDLTALGVETLQNAQDAAQSASDAEDAKDDAVTAKEAAEAAASTLQNVSATATTLEPNQPATASYNDGVFSFGIPKGESSGGTSDYTDLTNKPSINNVTLTENKTAADLGLATPSDIPTTAGDIEFDDTQTYPSETVGAELSQQKNAISQLESEVVTDVTVTGTDVTIVAQANKRYLCGTVSTIAVTPCATGAFDLIFTSGTSAAILTIPNTVKWQDSSFDPTALDTDTIYEISVADGTLGLVAKWT